MDQLGLIGYCGVGAAGIQYGNGVHQWDVNVPDAIEFAKVCCHQFHRTTGPGRGRKAKELVGQRERGLLHLLDLYHEALHLATIPAHFRAESKRPGVLHRPVPDLGEPDRLSCVWVRRIVPMLAARTDLESLGSGHMPRFWRDLGQRWHH